VSSRTSKRFLEEHLHLCQMINFFFYENGCRRDFPQTLVKFHIKGNVLSIFQMFLRWADDEHSNLLKLFDVNCASPQHLAGLSMTNISREDLQAERKQGKTDVRIESKLETRLTNWNRRASVAKVSRKSYKIFMNAARGCSEQRQVVKKTFLHQPRRLLLKKSVKEEVTNSFESGSGSARSECSSAFGQFGVLCFSVFMTNSYF